MAVRAVVIQDNRATSGKVVIWINDIYCIHGHVHIIPQIYIITVLIYLSTHSQQKNPQTVLGIYYLFLRDGGQSIAMRNGEHLCCFFLSIFYCFIYSI